MTVVSLIVAYRSFGKFRQVRHPPRYAAFLTPPSPSFGHSSSTGLKLCGAGEWLEEKHGTKRRRAWRVLHLATDADTGRIVASELTDRDADDCVFRRKAAAGSDASRPVIPTETSHPFRGEPAIPDPG